MSKIKRCWSIDLGKDTSKIVMGMLLKNNQILVEDYWILKTPWEIFEKEMPMETVDLYAFLREVLKKHKRNESLNLSINHHAIVIESFVFPIMSKEELEKAVYWKTAFYVDQAVSKWQFDFLAQEWREVFEYLGINDEKLDVIGIGIPKTILRRYDCVFKKSRHPLTSIVPQFYTLGKLFTIKKKERRVVIDMGNSGTRVFLFQGSFLFQAHHIAIGLPRKISHGAKESEKYLNAIGSKVISILESPSSLKKGFRKTAVFLFGGGSLLSDVTVILSEKLERNVSLVSDALFNEKNFVFKKEIRNSELLKLIPCLGGLIKDHDDEIRA